MAKLATQRLNFDVQDECLQRVGPDPELERTTEQAGLQGAASVLVVDGEVVWAGATGWPTWAQRAMTATTPVYFAVWHVPARDLTLFTAVNDELSSGPDQQRALLRVALGVTP